MSGFIFLQSPIYWRWSFWALNHSGVGPLFFSAKVIWIDTCASIHGSYRVISLKVSLLQIGWLLSPTWACLGKARPDDFMSPSQALGQTFPHSWTMNEGAFEDNSDQVEGKPWKIVQAASLLGWSSVLWWQVPRCKENPESGLERQQNHEIHDSGDSQVSDVLGKSNIITWQEGKPGPEICGIVAPESESAQPAQQNPP